VLTAPGHSNLLINSAAYKRSDIHEDTSSS
jgi:hypothetical protein